MTTYSKLMPAVFWLVLALLFVTSAGVKAGEETSEPMNLLFIHHSCGGQLFAAPGEVVGGDREKNERCIYVSHPNGGGLRGKLETAGYTVNEASYGSVVGEDTDICHWHAKFTGQMDRILKTQRQDSLLPEGQTNQVVCFKSCYPNNYFVGEGSGAGNADDCERTVVNAKAAYNAILPTFAEQPDVLFVAFTAPPMAEYVPVGLKAKIKSWFNKQDRGGDLAIGFNEWLTDRENGWLAGYEGNNVVVFDYYSVLRAGNAKGYTNHPTRDGRDSHPSSQGNQKAAEVFMPFIAQAVQGMGW